MKITEDVRQYAKELGLTPEEALQEGMESKSVEFRQAGSSIYQRI
jgi:phosphomethylpyrimidine synthase